MISKIDSKIALRYLKPKKKEGFLKLISILIGLMGVLLIIGFDPLSNFYLNSSQNLIPKIAIIISALGYVISSILAYNLKKDVTKEQYYNFSQKLDQPKTPTIRGVRSFKPVEIKGSDQDELPYQIVEVIDVESWERWQEIMESSEFKDVVDGWLEVADVDSLVTTYGELVPKL